MPSKSGNGRPVLELLGFEIYSLALMIRLPMRKLQEATAAMVGTKSGNTTTAIESVVGKLAHAPQVVAPGKMFNEENVRTPEKNQAMIPQDQAQPGVQVRPVVVARFHGGME